MDKKVVRSLGWGGGGVSAPVSSDLSMVAERGSSRWDKWVLTGQLPGMLSTSACSFLGVCPYSIWIAPVTPQHHLAYGLATGTGTTQALSSGPGPNPCWSHGPSTGVND